MWQLVTADACYLSDLVVELKTSRRSGVAKFQLYLWYGIARKWWNCVSIFIVGFRGFDERNNLRVVVWFESTEARLSQPPYIVILDK